jgi:hypothetical protein
MSRRTVSAEEMALWRRAVGDDAPAGGRPIAPSLAAPRPNRIAPQSRRADATPAFGGGDPRLDRAAARRRLPIERRLDLHGLTQAEAHVRLVRFLTGAARQGVRTALIVTGKGRPPGGGVIRRRFLDWIEQPPLRALIARAAPAARRDGGEGAFYVFLKARPAGSAYSRPPPIRDQTI